MRLGCVAIGDFEYNGAGFLFNMIKQILRRLQHIEKEVSGFFFLDVIEYLKRCTAAGNLGDVFAMKLKGVCVAAESKRVFPSDPARSVNIPCNCIVI